MIFPTGLPCHYKGLGFPVSIYYIFLINIYPVDETEKYVATI